MKNVRIYSWGRGQLSWAYVMSRLGEAFERLGNNVYFMSTNGIANNDAYLNDAKIIESAAKLQGFGPGKKQINIDLTYTVPKNLPQRFLSNSKHKCCIYNFETTYWPNEWGQYYVCADLYFPSSNFSAEIFVVNGVPVEKIFVIPHGVDTKIFSPSISPIKLRTEKGFRFVSVCAPHARKNIPGLLDCYCQAFTNKDDVCLVLKSKVYRHSDGLFDQATNLKGRNAFEIVLGDEFRRIQKRYGKQTPEIELLAGHYDNPASIYNACQVHISTTGSEGYGLPELEVMATGGKDGKGIFNIATRCSGLLDFMNDDNSLLIDCCTRYSLPEENYWGFNPKSKIYQIDNNHCIELMHKAYNEFDILVERFRPNMKKTVDALSWESAAQKIIDVTEGKVNHYQPGTYDLEL